MADKGLGPCLALTFTGNHCPSEAHEEIGVGKKQLAFCSHHFGMVKAILKSMKGRKVNEVNN